VPTTAAASAAIAALIQAIAAKELEEPSAPGLYRESLEESYFQAASHGLEAEILFDSDDPEPAPLVIERMLTSIRPYCRELGSEPALAELERILSRGNGAADQRRVERASGMAGLLDDLVERATA